MESKKFCIYCEEPLKSKQQKYCSKKCKRKSHKKTRWRRINTTIKNNKIKSKKGEKK